MPSVQVKNVPDETPSVLRRRATAANQSLQDYRRQRPTGERLAAPELTDLEVMSVFRKLVDSNALSIHRAGLALADLEALPLQRVPHRALLPGCWRLRPNLTAYDASYVSLAEHLGAVFLTADTRLAGAPGLPCRVALLS